MFLPKPKVENKNVSLINILYLKTGKMNMKIDPRLVILFFASGRSKHKRTWGVGNDPTCQATKDSLYFLIHKIFTNVFYLYFQFIYLFLIFLIL